jgi:hypothetical protein
MLGIKRIRGGNLVRTVASVLGLLVFVSFAATAGDQERHPQLGGGSRGVVGPAGGYEGGPSETGFGSAPFYSHKGFGADFVKCGVATRVVALSAGGIPQTEPFILDCPALPVGAAPVQVFVVWNWLLDGAPPPVDTIIINGVPVVGTLSGSGTPDLCWGKGGEASYKAQLDPADSPVIHGPLGGNLIFGATDKALGVDPLAYGEGISILCVYDDPSSPEFRSVDVYCGYTSTESSPVPLTAVGSMTFTNVYHGGDLHFFLNCLDGQIKFGDDFFINGALVSGAVAGTNVPTDAWAGLFPFGPAPSPPNDNLYDHANDDIAPLGLVPIGALGLSFSTVSTTHPVTGIRDCVGHSFGAVSFPATQTWMNWSPGEPCAPSGVTPVLTGTGKAIQGDLAFTTAVLTSAPPLTPAFLVIGFTSLRLPFKGGILGPSPDIILNLFTDATGSITLPFTIPAGTPPGTMLWAQYWFADAVNFCSSNTLKLTTQ